MRTLMNSLSKILCVCTVFHNLFEYQVKKAGLALDNKQISSPDDKKTHKNIGLIFSCWERPINMGTLIINVMGAKPTLTGC